MFKKILVFFFLFMSFTDIMAQETFQKLHEEDSDIRIPVIPRPPFIPMPPSIVVPDAKEPIVEKSLNIAVEVIGNIATTTYDIVYYNPNHRILEGEFVIPLNETQNVSAIALDINGQMRDGVVVEKEKGRQTFEAVVRRGVDPALAEKTAGNQFKLRIYPLNAQGTRHVRVTIEETLPTKNGIFSYVIPLNFGRKLEEFSIKVRAPINVEQPKVVSDLQGFSFTNQTTYWQGEFSAKDYKLDNKLSFDLTRKSDSQVFTHKEGNKTYFYANVVVKKSEKAKELPKKISVIWDASLSGTKRDLTAEKALLKSYLQKIGDVEVAFSTFNLSQSSIKSYNIKGGDFSELEKEIDSIVYDGATRFDNLDTAAAGYDEYLIFTDGISSFGDSNFVVGSKPIYIISSSSEFERGILTETAQRSLGSFINLKAVDLNAALDKLTKRTLRVVSYEHDSSLSEIFPLPGSEILEDLSFAGISNANSTKLKVNFGYSAEDITETKTITVEAKGNNPAVERLWAKNKIAQLEQNPSANEDEILKLGQQYSVVTEKTSLIVLENVSDYVQYEITPPAELLSQYNSLIANRRKQEQANEVSAIEDSIKQANIVKDWWNKKYDPVLLPKPKPFERLHQDEDSASAGASIHHDIDGVRRPDIDGLARRGGMMKRSAFARSDSVADGMVGMQAMEANDEIAEGDSPTSLQGSTAKITLQAWDPDTPYLRILKKSSDDELYRDYLKLKDGFNDTPSFYFDVTDEFMRRGMKSQGLIVLSNITEMKLENVELLRIAAQKLLELEYPEYALEIFKKILKLRGSDPQPYRDVALTQEILGQDAEALKTFYQIMQKNWGRFNPIKQVVFVEMNRLITANPKLDVSGINKELIFPMSVDIRITLSWSSDDTDIDLHVSDPNNENCYYGHKLTTIGGRYTHDFTQGFGPEEFMLKKALKGKYTIKTNNFADRRQSISGPSTLYLDIYTHYATPQETHKRILVRAGGVKDDNKIGEIEFD